MSPMQRICAIISTGNQPEQALPCLLALHSQTRRPDFIILSGQQSAELQQQASRLFGEEAVYTVEAENAAEALHRGMQYAFEQLRADYAWDLDARCTPHPECLEKLLRTDTPSPTVRQSLPLHRGELSYPLSLSRGGKFCHAMSLTELPADNIITCCYPGALYPRAATLQAGLPDARLCMQGEREEYALRLQQAGVSICLVRDAVTESPALPAFIHYKAAGRSFVYTPGKSLEEHYYCMRNRAWIAREAAPRAYIPRLLSCGWYMLSTIRAMIQANEVSPARLYLVFRGQHNGFYGKLRPY